MFVPELAVIAQQLLEMPGVLVVVLDALGHVVWVNQVAAKLVGHSPESLLGTRWIDRLVPPAEQASVENTFRQVMLGRADQSVNSVQGADGAMHTVLWHARQFAAGAQTFVMGLGTVITEYARVQQALQQSEVRLRSIVDTVACGILTIDGQGVTQSFNPAAERIFGYGADEAVGQSIAMLMPEPHRSRHRQYLERYHETGERRVISIGREVSGRRKDGTIVPLSLAVSEMIVDGERYYTGIVWDISERKAAEEALRQSEERLHAMQQHHTELERIAVVGEVSAIVAHEVRTPLNALSINTQMLRRLLARDDDEGRQKAADLVATIQHEVERINRLIEDYLRVARRPTPEHSLLDVAAVAKDALAFLAPQAARASVELVGPTGPMVPRVLGQEAQLRQVLLNLLLNAVQALATQRQRKDRGRIEVELALVDDEVLIHVRDNGPGIAPDQLGQIFRPFVTTKDKGTGLGLAVCERLLRGMGGSIAARSVFGAGACFTVRLPVIEGPPRYQ